MKCRRRCAPQAPPAQLRPYHPYCMCDGPVSKLYFKVWQGLREQVVYIYIIRIYTFSLLTIYRRTQFYRVRLLDREAYFGFPKNAKEVRRGIRSGMQRLQREMQRSLG